MPWLGRWLGRWLGKCWLGRWLGNCWLPVNLSLIPYTLETRAKSASELPSDEGLVPQGQDFDGRGAGTCVARFRRYELQMQGSNSIHQN